MDIILENIGRRFNRDWIFRRLDYSFKVGRSYAILGPNGSGKSTLLQVIASSLTPSAGSVSYTSRHGNVEPDQVYRHLSLAAPYMELVEEFTLVEQIRFHFSHKAYLQGFDEQALLELMGLDRAKDRPIKYFSSGMKQRVKLSLACCADVPLLLLDEPTTNLDQKGVAWYQHLVRETSGGRLLLVCSNHEREYDFCDHTIDVTHYKA
ncbi:ATP-binding cassette domain-containing protein [Parapedobacter deserti]|uniref:ATP-binding cassette domain-containing protein n=1 Tax=Parapedobacter deserti TaxID=1912957 RepID=A0ABV7JV67_9SPHI